MAFSAFWIKSRLMGFLFEAAFADLLHLTAASWCRTVAPAMMDCVPASKGFEPVVPFFVASAIGDSERLLAASLETGVTTHPGVTMPTP